MFPLDSQSRTPPHGDPLRMPAAPIPAEDKILWELGSTFVEGFIDPESLFFYLRQTGTDTCIVLNVADLAAIVKAIADRVVKSRAVVDAPTDDDLPF